MGNKYSTDCCWSKDTTTDSGEHQQGREYSSNTMDWSAPTTEPYRKRSLSPSKDTRFYATNTECASTYTRWGATTSRWSLKTPRWWRKTPRWRTKASRWGLKTSCWAPTCISWGSFRTCCAPFRISCVKTCMFWGGMGLLWGRKGGEFEL